MELSIAEIHIEHVTAAAGTSTSIIDYGTTTTNTTTNTMNINNDTNSNKCDNNNNNNNTSSNISYYDLVKNNYEYRLFITSYLITNLGEWLTYIASIDFIEEELLTAATAAQQQQEQQQQSSSRRSAISLLVVVRLLPNVLLSCFGGTIADVHDRKNVMVILNIGGAICALIFVLAYQLRLVSLIYVATFIQQCIAGLYAPSSSAIIPMLINNNQQELKKATTLEGICWSCMTAFGAATSGIVVDLFGSRICFLLDGATFLISAGLLWMLPGNYNVTKTKTTTTFLNNENENEDDELKQKQQQHYYYEKSSSMWQQFTCMVKDGFHYLMSSYFGAIALLKCTIALAYGASDILIVAFSELNYDGGEHHNDDDRSNNSNAKLGMLFSVVGIGCLLGPLITEPLIDLERPSSVQLSCVVGFALSAIGYIGWSIEDGPFWIICVFGLIRSAGSSTVWINSTLLLQKFSSPEVLGRVLSIDYALALLGEAFAAYLCGIWMDTFHLTAHQVSFWLSIFSLLLLLIWGWYHYSGRGAGKYVVVVPMTDGQYVETSNLLVS